MGRRHPWSADAPLREEQWLICEWSYSKSKPTAFYLSNLPLSTPRKQLVFLTKLRWRIERDYQELKSELGLDHFEGRTWRGLHHHVALAAAAHAFLTLHRAALATDNGSEAPSGPEAPSDSSSEEADVRAKSSRPLTLPAFRALLQVVLLRMVGHCPSCGRAVSKRSRVASPRSLLVVPRAPPASCARM